MHLVLLLGGLVLSFPCPAFSGLVAFLGTLGQGAGGESVVSLLSDEMLALGMECRAVQETNNSMGW